MAWAFLWSDVLRRRRSSSIAAVACVPRSTGGSALQRAYPGSDGSCNDGWWRPVGAALAVSLIIVARAPAVRADRGHRQTTASHDDWSRWTRYVARHGSDAAQDI